MPLESIATKSAVPGRRSAWWSAGDLGRGQRRVLVSAQRVEAAGADVADLAGAQGPRSGRRGSQRGHLSVLKPPIWSVLRPGWCRCPGPQVAVLDGDLGAGQVATWLLASAPTGRRSAPRSHPVPSAAICTLFQARWAGGAQGDQVGGLQVLATWAEVHRATRAEFSTPNCAGVQRLDGAAAGQLHAGPGAATCAVVREAPVAAQGVICSVPSDPQGRRGQRAQVPAPGLPSGPLARAWPGAELSAATMAESSAPRSRRGGQGGTWTELSWPPGPGQRSPLGRWSAPDQFVPSARMEAGAWGAKVTPSRWPGRRQSGFDLILLARADLGGGQRHHLDRCQRGDLGAVPSRAIGSPRPRGQSSVPSPTWVVVMAPTWAEFSTANWLEGQALRLAVLRLDLAERWGRPGPWSACHLVECPNWSVRPGPWRCWTRPAGRPSPGGHLGARQGPAPAGCSGARRSAGVPGPMPAVVMAATCTRAQPRDLGRGERGKVWSVVIAGIQGQCPGTGARTG